MVSLQRANEPSAEVEVMGVGLSVNTLAKYLRELNIGKPKKEITGYLTIEDDFLRLSLKMTAKSTVVLAQKMTGTSNKYTALDTLLEKTAASVLKTISPASYTFYDFNQRSGGFDSEFENASEKDFDRFYNSIKRIAENDPHKPEQALSYSLWGFIMSLHRFSAWGS